MTSHATRPDCEVQSGGKQHSVTVTPFRPTGCTAALSCSPVIKNAKMHPALITTSPWVGRGRGRGRGVWGMSNPPSLALNPPSLRHRPIWFPPVPSICMPPPIVNPSDLLSAAGIRSQERTSSHLLPRHTLISSTLFGKFVFESREQ